MKKFSFKEEIYSTSAICAMCANCLMRDFANSLILADSNIAAEIV